MRSCYLWKRVDTKLKRIHMMCRLLVACAALTFLANSACADGLGDAKAGLEALNRGDSAAAVSLLTKAITNGQLARSDKELAYVKRAEAYLAMGAKEKALADATKALALDASDSEAATVREKARRATENGPSLAITMKFIQDKLNDIGPVNYVVYTHDGEKGNSDYSNRWSYELSNAIVDPASCFLHVNQRIGVNYVDHFSVDSLALKDVSKIVVIPEDQYLNWVNSINGSPYLTAQVNPLVHTVELTGKNNMDWTLRFLDEDVANRVAKALLHAVELCGGGKTDEPF